MIEMNVVDVLEENFIPFAGETLLNNLPSICDGLLSSHRKIIYALHKNGVNNNKSHIKLLRAAAMAMTYYVYGDLPLNKVMKGMGNNSLNYMYLNPKGSFGDKQKRDGVGASARYIECKLSKYSEDMLSGINKNAVPTKRNFDNTEDEPLVLPSVMPNVLLNTSQSIAVGESSKIPAHNLIEVCDSFISYLQTEDIDKSISMLNGADLSLGGQIVYDKAEFEKIYRTGKGSFTLVGKHTYNKKENKITITEVPYETYIEVIEEKLRLQYDKGKFKEVVDIHDGSDKDGIKLDIYLKKGTDIAQFISKLRKYTPYESKMSCNFTLIDIDHKTPILMSLEDIIVKWAEHRKNCLRREMIFDIDKLVEEENELSGLKIVLLDIDKAISIIRNSQTEKEAIASLMSQMQLNEKQAEYVADIKLRNLNQSYLTKKIDRLDLIQYQLQKMRDSLDSEDYYKATIISQLTEIKSKYGQPRRTTIIHQDEVETISNDTLIENFNNQIVLTKEGYFKRTMKYSESQKVKDGDYAIQQIPSTNKSKLLFFTDKANCYYLNAYDISPVQPSVLGTYLPTLLQLQDENIICVVSTEDFNGFMLFAFENGRVAKINLSSYATKTNRTKVINAFNTDSPLVSIHYIEKDCDFEAVSSINKVLVLDSSQINAKSSKSSQGVNVLKSKKDSVMVEFKLSPFVNDIEEAVKEYYRANIPATGKYRK